MKPAPKAQPQPEPQAGIPIKGRRIPSLAALIFVVGVLLVFNLSVWRVLRDFEQSKHADLIERLRMVGRTIVHDLTIPFPPVVLTLMTPETELDHLDGFAGTQSYRELARRLQNLQRINELAQVVLLTPRGLVVADSTGATQPGDSSIWTIDQSQFDAAASGRADQWLFYTLDKQPFARVYLPLIAEGRVLAVLQVAARPTFLDEMKATRRRVLFQSLLSSGLLVLIGASIFRLFNYLVQVERTAIQGARIQAMGTLAGGIAHELRNPLSIIRMMAEEVKQESPEESRCAQNAVDIIAEVERLNEITSQFLSLSRAPDSQVRREVDIGAELGLVVQLIRKTAISRTARYETDIPAHSLVVLGDERALRQVMLNLLINATEALPPKDGLVRVVARDRGNHMEVRISDNGHGIPKRDLARIFEPFYTTKTMGTGLGLSISRRIIEDAGGRLKVASRVGKGTEVTIILPSAPREHQGPAHEPETNKPESAL